MESVNDMRIKNGLMLLLTAFIWGTAFVAQSVGMDYLEPFTFNGVRSLIGGAAADFFNRHPEILAYANRYMRDELAAIPPRTPSYPESIRRLGIRGVLFMNSSSVILNSFLASRLPPLGRSDALWGRRPVLDTVHAGDRPDRAGRLRHLHLQAESFFRHA